MGHTVTIQSFVLSDFQVHNVYIDGMPVASFERIESAKSCETLLTYWLARNRSKLKSLEVEPRACNIVVPPRSLSFEDAHIIAEELFEHYMGDHTTVLTDLIAHALVAASSGKTWKGVCAEAAPTLRFEPSKSHPRWLINDCTIIYADSEEEAIQRYWANLPADRKLVDESPKIERCGEYDQATNRIIGGEPVYLQDDRKSGRTRET